jgi:meiotically up-regulated gene 157 (Mug157) protein
MLRWAVATGKYELDTLCSTLRLSAQYVATTQDTSVLDADWLRAMRTIYDTMRYFQRGTYFNEADLQYSFSRMTNDVMDTQYGGGRGCPGRFTGMVRSFFRGSDDANLLPFHLPSTITSLCLRYSA